MKPVSNIFLDRLNRVLNENMQIDWQSQLPTQTTQQPEEQEVQQFNNSDVQYIFELSKSIKEKLDLLIEAVSREELQKYAESQIKSVITDMITVETKIMDDTICLNALSDTINNLSREQGNNGATRVLNGLIQL